MPPAAACTGGAFPQQLTNKLDIERVQKATLQVILGEDYTSYSAACELTNLLTLDERRIKLCKTFALRTLKNIKHKQWFKIDQI